MSKPRLQAWTALVRVVDAPGEVFQYLAEAPSILPPYLANTLLGIAAVALSLPATLRFMESQFSQQGLPSTSLISSWLVVGGVLGAVLGPVLAGLFISGLVFGMLWIAGHGITFRSIFSVVGYARIPLAIGALINGWLIHSATSFVQINQISLSAAVLAPSGTPRLVMAFLSTLAPFDLWYFALVTVGVATVSGRPIFRVWWTAAVLYGMNLLMVLLGSGFSASSVQ